MKKVLFSIALVATALTACNQAQPGPAPLAQFGAPRAPMMQAASTRSDDNPAFLRKLQNPAGYRFEFDTRRSICGANDMQHVNDYDGSLGQPVEFVKQHEGAVAALAMGSPDASSRKFCSGTMISEDLFLTASHCVDGSITKNWAVFNYEKAAGSSDVLPQEHFKILEVVENGGRLDYSILRIDGKPGLKYGFNRVRAELPEDGHLLTIIQHPRGQVKQIESGPKVGVSGNYMSYADLDTEPGSSGSGVLDSDGFVVGVHTNGGCYSSGGANKGVKMTEIAKASATIQSLIQQQSRR